MPSFCNNFTQVPAIYRIVDTLHLLIYFLPYDVEVYLYLVWALAQNLVAAPYLFWDWICVNGPIDLSGFFQKKIW